MLSVGISTLRLAIRLLKRDWRAGELRILCAAIAVAVSSVTAVTFFTDRIDQALKLQANELLAADLRLVSDHAIAPAYRKKADELGLAVAQTLNFRSMLLANNKSRLAEVKAVDTRYPLRGQVRLFSAQMLSDYAAVSIPLLGTVWIERALISQLGVEVGDTVRVGDIQLKIAAIIQYEPDRGGGMFSIGPRVMLNMQDIAATGLIQEGSRIHTHLLVAGQASVVKQYRRWLTQKLQPGERIESVVDARQELRIALQRANQFLGLSALVSVILAYIAIAMSAQRFAERHLDACALMRCFGAQQAQLVWIYFIQMLGVGLLVSLFACLIGFLAQAGLVHWLGGMLLVELPAPSFWPVVSGLLVGSVGLLGFALPPVLKLREVPTLRVLRRDLTGKTPLGLASYSAGFVALATLLIWQAGDLRLGFIVLGGLLASGILAIILTRVLIGLVRILVSKSTLSVKFGIGNIIRHRNRSVTQVLAFAVGIAVLLLLTIVRGDIMNAWQHSIPNDAPNRFVVNIQPDQLDAVTRFLSTRSVDTLSLDNSGLKQAVFFPMVRARLHAINDKPVVSKTQDEQRSRQLARREYYLSMADQVQLNNKIVEGTWWGIKGKPQFSVETGVAKRLGIKIGDRLTFMIAGSSLQAVVTSLRTVQWNSFSPNFFFLAPLGALNEYPKSYITSFYITEQRYEVLDELIKTFPNLTVIDISAILQQIRNIINRVSLAIEYVFVFTLMAGITVLYAAIQASHDQRLLDNAILRALGASRRRLVTGLATEFFILGSLAGIIAAMSAYGLGYWLAVGVFELSFAVNLWILPLAVVGGGLGIGIVGLFGTRKILSRPPLSVLNDV